MGCDWKSRSSRRLSAHTISARIVLPLAIALSNSRRSSAFLPSPTCSSRNIQLERGHLTPKFQRLNDSFLFSSVLDGAVSGENDEGRVHSMHPTSYIVSYDGAIASNARERCRLCLGIALDVWPNLWDRIGNGTTSSITGNDDGDEQWTWVLNKMEALIAAMSNDGTDKDGLSVMVDLVMLARLILEEQQLDDGRNGGRGGKYGGKYHPQQQQQKMPSSPTPVGSRPLTVGEIGANWLDGGHLRDTVRVKYNVEKKDPFPIIRQHIIEAMSSAEDGLVTKGSANRLTGSNQLFNLMQTSDDDAIILLDHGCRKLEAMDFIKDNFAGSTPCKIIAPLAGEESELDIIKSLIFNVDDSDVPKRICIIHNSLSLLQRLKRILGGDSPRLQGGYTKIPNTSVEIGLFLPAWSDCTSLQQENDATMDPWLNVMTEEDLARLAESQAAVNAWE